MILRRVGLLALLGLSVLLAACAQPAADGVSDQMPQGSFALISPLDAFQMIEANRENPDFVLLDIRRPEEVEAGHIAGATTLDYYSETFRDDLSSLDRETTYLIYCRTGNRTGRTIGIMEDLGFQTVYDLDGGITAWQAAGLTACVGPLDQHHLCYADPSQPEANP